jgi:hypothetical protein
LANCSDDKIIELIRLPPQSVECKADETLEPKYEVTLKNGTKRTYRWQDILHVPTLGNLARSNRRARNGQAQRPEQNTKLANRVALIGKPAQKAAKQKG